MPHVFRISVHTRAREQESGKSAAMERENIMSDNILIRLCGLFETTSPRTGRRYFTGFLGHAKVLLLELPEGEREEGRPTWTLFIAARPDKAASERSPPLANRARPNAERPRPQPSSPVNATDRPFDDSIPF